MTMTVVDWIDAFTRPAFSDVIVDSLKFCQKEKGLIIYAWCLMSNHLHLIAAAQDGYSLSGIVRDFKKFTSKKIVHLVKTEPESRRDWMLYRFAYAGKYLQRIKDYKFWQDGFHPIELFDATIAAQKLEYLHQNPVTARIVNEPEHYVYSSAINYSGLPGLIDVEFLFG